MNQIIQIAVTALWFLIPGLVANGAPVLISGLIKKKHRIDFGITLKNGSDLFGKTKTIEGFIAGTITGGLAGLLLEHLNWVNIPGMGLHLGLILGSGALLGDLIGSFIKRRLKMKSGQTSPILDQIDILFGIYPLIFFTGIIFSAFWIPFHIIYCLFLMKAFSIIGYLLRLKKDPW